MKRGLKYLLRRPTCNVGEGERVTPDEEGTEIPRPLQRSWLVCSGESVIPDEEGTEITRCRKASPTGPQQISACHLERRLSEEKA